MVQVSQVVGLVVGPCAGLLRDAAVAVAQASWRKTWAALVEPQAEALGFSNVAALKANEHDALELTSWHKHLTS